MLTAEQLLTMSRRELMGVLCAGYPIEPRELDDTEYKGVSLGLGRLIERLTWKTFKKTFHRDPGTGRLRGWNVRIVQDGLDAPYRPQLAGDRPVTFGHYEVVSSAGYRLPQPCAQGLIIDYGRGRNGRLDPTNRARDPLVAVNAGSVELLLGWTYLDLGVRLVETPSFFSLERDCPLSHRAVPPRGLAAGA